MDFSCSKYTAIPIDRRPYIAYVIGYKHIPVISILFSGPDEGMLITGMQCTRGTLWEEWVAYLGKGSSYQINGFYFFVRHVQDGKGSTSSQLRKEMKEQGSEGDGEFCGGSSLLSSSSDIPYCTLCTSQAW